MTKKLQVMLASSEIPTPEQLVFPLDASFKVDGLRCAQINGQAMSRKMLPLENPFVQAWALEYQDYLHGLDGEMVVGLPYAENDEDDVFNRSSGPLGRLTGEPNFAYYVFDTWEATDLNAAERTHLLKDRNLTAIPRVQLIAQKRINNIAELMAYMAEALALGYEGLILKKLRGLYKNGRSTLLEGVLLKWKEFADSEAIILSVNQGTTNTNEAKKDELGHTKRSSAKAGKVLTETVGSFMVQDIYTGVIFKCPPCGTQSEVDAMWVDRANLPGQIITYKYQKVGTMRKPRFPGMRRFRPRSDIDESNAVFLLPVVPKFETQGV
jgi:DNA ligase 1